MSDKVDASPDINKIAAAVIVSATESTLKQIAAPAQTAARRLFQLVSDAYKPYLETTFQRVRTIRTFLKPNEPVDLIEHYVPTSLRMGEQKEQSAEAVLERFVGGGRVVVSGIAGRGKSVLLRFFALSLYHNPRGRIPLFLELRALNQTGSKEIINFIHSQYKGSSGVPLNDFKAALKKGYFALILDGFDEIEPEARAAVEAQILAIGRDLPACPIIVSGRPDERFASWEHFDVYNVAPMTHYKTRKLIEKADYDAEVKKEFLKRLTKEFFAQHESFLSTPLLAIMLMLTFEDFAEIPTTLHVFYRNAFDTLVRRHDAMKSQFLRQMHSGCSAEQFRKLFASFCLITYSKSKYQFHENEVPDYLEMALNQQGIEADKESVLLDIIESICLLQREGFETSFVHRSFQEYFCALFVSQLPAGAVARYLESGRYRTYDNVLPMLFAMVPERVEAEWVAPKIKNIIALYDHTSDPVLSLAIKAYGTMNYAFYKGNHVIPHFDETDNGRAISILQRLYLANFVGNGYGQELSEEESERMQATLVSRLKELEASGDKRFNEVSKKLNESAKPNLDHRLPSIKVSLQENDGDLVRLMWTGHYLSSAVKTLPELGQEVDGRVEKEDAFLVDVFGS